MKTQMKRLPLLFLLFLAYTASAQDQAIEYNRRYSDSLLRLVRTENNKEKKEDLLSAFYQASIDGFPLLLLEIGQKLLDLSRERKDPMIESSAWSAFGQGYRLTGNYVRALELHQKAVALAEQSGSDRTLAFALNQSGHIFKDRLENEQALKIYHAAKYYNRTSSASATSAPYLNLAAVHLALENLDSALYYANKASESLNKISSRKGNYIANESNMATIYSMKGDLTAARTHFSNAITIAYELKSPRYLNVCYGSMAQHYLRLKLYDSAALFNQRAIEAVQNTAVNNLALKPARALIDYYQNINADSTVKYWLIYSAANDSLNSTRANQQIQMLTLESEQRKRDIEQAKRDSRAKWQITSLIGGLLSAILILSLMARASRRRKKDLDKLAKAYSELSSTQQQLIQAEKMASLGELTAGIAHEIQNPLNFVNNFSSLNRELIDETREAINAGDLNEAKDVLGTMAENEDKILHHGKRADAIVKGMLQHSRTGTGVKESTDINALTDEYLRLAYHGLKAKDKSFNAQFKTEFDPNIGKVDVVPQDIGRVLLNLISNAFYAVNEKKKVAGDGYVPEVTVKTELRNSPISQLANQLIVSVRDNGLGIPETNRNKIFQPFFTTKPTGEGTGLGLSLSYDIIKAHGGEIKVESKEGEGTTFSIILNQS
jgi:two-component system, NtrC family, sensor kinase